MPRGGKRNAYPEDFRQSAIELALNDDRSIHEIAKELGIYPKTLYGWVNKYKKEQSMSGKGNCYDNAACESFFGSLKPS